MISKPYIACFGAAHWDHVGKQSAGTAGPDRPGTVRVRPGGVAANVAIGLAANGLRPALYSVVGCDREGEALRATLANRGMETSGILSSEAFPTGAYIAVEDETGELVSAVADCRALEALAPGAFDTRSARQADYWFIEANLPVSVIEELASIGERPPLVANPVSPARARSLLTILPKIAVLYCNRAEAGALLDCHHASSEEAAKALFEAGAGRAVVTDGPASVCDASAEGIFSAMPDTTEFASATGAGDAFLARHLAAVAAGTTSPMALNAAIQPDRKEPL